MDNKYNPISYEVLERGIVQCLSRYVHLYVQASGHLTCAEAKGQC